jgi:hypothetical protein
MVHVLKNEMNNDMKKMENELNDTRKRTRN